MILSSSSRLMAAVLGCVCLISVSAGADTIQTLVARPELPEGHRSPLCILLPGGSGRMPEASSAMSGLGNRLADRGWIVIVPISPDGTSFFGDAASHVVSVMEQFAGDSDVRPGRVLLAGVSNGGISALQVASRVPDRISGVIAVPGMLHDRVILRQLRNLPIYIRIGADDHLGWAKHYDDIVGKLNRAGVRLDARLLDEVGHGIPIDWAELDAWMAKELGAMAPARWRETQVTLPAHAAQFRRWTSRSGATLEAVLAEIHEDHVVLMRRNQQKSKIRREHLSPEDQAYLGSLVQAADKNR